MKKIFDCFVYNGEIDLLEIRLNELNEVVDWFVIVEGTHTFSGAAKAGSLLDEWSRLRPFAHKIRYVVVSDLVRFDGAWERETHQRNSCVRALADAESGDVVLLSNVDEIPRSSAVAEMRDTDAAACGFELSSRYFALNYCNVVGPEAALVRTVGFDPVLLQEHTPEQLRYAIRDGSVAAKIFPTAGWHFSYLSDEAGVRRKIQAFSHQEFNTVEFLGALDIANLIRARGDLFGREDFEWQVVDPSDLPAYIHSQGDRFSTMILSDSLQGDDTLNEVYRPAPKKRSWLQRRREARAKKPAADREPIIVCPYVHPGDEERVRKAFGLDSAKGKRLPFYFWHDTDLVGPEAAFQRCWSQFPERDVIIIHTDMAPMPGDETNTWYERLLQHVADLPDAGAVACDLLYPEPTSSGSQAAQCAGGRFNAEGKIFHNGGAEHAYDARYDHVRIADWVTFGGVYIRRAAIDMVGEFDARYEWAYVMDVDYSLEMRLRGWNLYQVPVNLEHAESQTTRPFVEQPEYQAKIARNVEYFDRKWSDLIVSNRMNLGRPS